MNTHPYEPETVMAYFDGQLSPADAANLTAHLHNCPDCSKLADNFIHVSGALAKWRVENVSAGEENLASFARTVGHNDKHPYRRVFLWAAAIGAACLFLAAILTPNLLRSKMAANESSAAGSLRTLTTAAIMYNDQYHHLPPSLSSLAAPTHGAPHADAADLIDKTLASGSKSGYRFIYQPFGNRYTISAEPINPAKTGVRSFSTDETGRIFVDGKPLDGQQPIDKAFQSFNTQDDSRSHPPMIARTVELAINVKDFASARSALDTLLLHHRGYAAQLSISGDPSSHGSLLASLRIPVSELDSVLAELKRLGRIERESQSGEEVTMQHADLAARISNSLETEARLKDILRTRTGKVADVLEVEQQISQTRGEIERMEAELKALETRVDFATLTLTLSTEFKDHVAELSPSAATRIHNAFVSGYTDARESLIDLAVWLLSTGPQLLLWLLILAAPAFWIWRRWRNIQTRAFAA